MLSKIKISNYALIDELEIPFFKGMLTVTGETGAGKSIILGALGLTLGDRVDTSVLRNTEKKCIIETTFELKPNFKKFFKTNDLDFDTETILRREISVTGKSRAFINDTPVSLTVLKELSTFLIDVHSQHQTLAINKSAFQLSVLDSLAKNDTLLANYSLSFKKYKEVIKELSILEENNAKLKADLDFFQIQFNELESANLDNLNIEELEQELNTLNNAEDIKQNLQESIYLLNNDEQGIISQLNKVELLLRQISGKNNSIDALLDRVLSLKIELKDVLEEKETIEENVVFDEEKITELSDKFTLVSSLLKKYNVLNTKELIEKREELEQNILNIASFDEKLKELTNKKEETHKELVESSDVLSQSRKKVVPNLEKEIEKLLGKLSMPEAVFKVEQSNLNEFTAKGKDQIEFLFSANKGMSYKPIGKVASGGELSRLMLCIKKVLASSKSLPTIIFDEIDTGVSGDVAAKMGEVMKQIAKSTQVISITHLPQIASKGHEHYFVYKKVKNNTTFTKMRRLTADERIRAIAQMLSGTDVSDAAIENAKSLLAK